MKLPWASESTRWLCTLLSSVEIEAQTGWESYRQIHVLSTSQGYFSRKDTASGLGSSVLQGIVMIRRRAGLIFTFFLKASLLDGPSGQSMCSHLCSPVPQDSTPHASPEKHDQEELPNTWGCGQEKQCRWRRISVSMGATDLKTLHSIWTWLPAFQETFAYWIKHFQGLCYKGIWGSVINVNIHKCCCFSVW